MSRFAELPGPAIVVFQDLDDPAVGATFGEIMCATYQAFGAAGLITSGAARDLDQVRRLGFPAFSNGVICLARLQSHRLDPHARARRRPGRPSGRPAACRCQRRDQYPRRNRVRGGAGRRGLHGRRRHHPGYCKAGNCEPKSFGEVRREAMHQIGELGKRVRARRATA